MSQLVRLGAFTFDGARACLHGPGGQVALRNKSFEVLRYLVDRSDRVVTKNELVDAVWSDVIVGDDSLAQCVTEIRRALGPTGRDVIKTLPRRGYMLSVPAAGSPTVAEPSTQATPALTLGPSIAVLPFANLGGSPQDDYLSDGIAEDIITELSRFSELLVIARNSSFQYNGRSIDVRQIGRELGVRYVLEGSVRRDADRARITAQLVDAVSGAHIWAERYDRRLDDVLAIQDEMARQIVAVLAVHVKKAEIERALTKPPAAWQAYDHYLRAADRITGYHSTYEKDALFAARGLLQQALAIEPVYARARAMLSSCYMSQWVHRWDDDYPWGEALDRCYQAARQSVQLAPELPEAHIALGQALTFLRQHDAALAAVERAVALNPNLTSFRFGYTYVLGGEAARGAQLLEKHMRLDPLYEPNALVALAFAYYMLERYRNALPLLQEAVSRAPDMAHGRYVLAMVYARLGEIDSAKAEAQIALRLEPWYKISQSLTARYFKRSEDTAHVVDGLRQAGFPE